MAACCKSFKFWVLCLLQSVFFELKLRRSEALKILKSCKHRANNGPFSPSLQNTNFQTIQPPSNPQSQPPCATKPPSFNSLHFDAEWHWILRGGYQPGVGHLEVGDLLFLPTTPLPKVTLQKHDINVSSCSNAVPGNYNGYNMQMMTMGMQNMQLGQPMYSSPAWSGSYVRQLSATLPKVAPFRNITLTIYRWRRWECKTCILVNQCTRPRIQMQTMDYVVSVSSILIRALQVHIWREFVTQRLGPWHSCWLGIPAFLRYLDCSPSAYHL